MKILQRGTLVYSKDVLDKVSTIFEHLLFFTIHFITTQTFSCYIYHNKIALQNSTTVYLQDIEKKKKKKKTATLQIKLQWRE